MLAPVAAVRMSSFGFYGGCAGLRDGRRSAGRLLSAQGCWSHRGGEGRTAERSGAELGGEESRVERRGQRCVAVKLPGSVLDKQRPLGAVFGNCK